MKAAECAVRRRVECRRASPGLDEPRRPRHRHSAGLQGHRDSARAHPSPRSPMRRASSTPRSSTWKWCTRPMARRLLRNFVLEICGCKGDWSMAHFETEMVHTHQAAGGLRPGDLRAVGRRRFRRHRRADPRGDRRAADLHLRRPRLDAPERGRRGGAAVPRAYNIPLVHVDASTALPRGAGRRDRSGGQAQDHRQALHRRVRGARRRRWAVRLSWRRARSIPM